MRYRKFTADHLFTGHEILAGGQVLITDPQGVIIEITDKKEAGEDIEVFKGLLSPGFINAHCHLELSHLKGAIPENTGLVNFVQEVMSRRTGAETERKTDAMQAAAKEMYDSGIAAVGDICNTADSIPVKQGSKLHWHNFIEVSGFVDAAAPKRLLETESVYQQFIDAGITTRISLSPHAPYSVSKTLFQLLNEKTAGKLISIHNQESKEENKLYQDKGGGFLSLYENFHIDISGFQPTGKTSLQSWLPYFNKGQSIILVHNTFIHPDDLDFIQSRLLNPTSHIYYCLCANANQYIEQQSPPVEQLRLSDAGMLIGTDSYASNRQLNILEEIKTIQRAANHSIPLHELLQWATINGARALQMDKILGSFDKGKQPGIVLIEGLDNLNTTVNSTAKRIL